MVDGKEVKDSEQSALPDRTPEWVLGLREPIRALRIVCLLPPSGKPRTWSKSQQMTGCWFGPSSMGIKEHVSFCRREDHIDFFVYIS